jgi:hypothetical protein
MTYGLELSIGDFLSRAKARALLKWLGIINCFCKVINELLTF